MKRVYESIAIILMLLLFCLADSFGQTTFKIVHKIYDYSAQQYKVDFDVKKELYIEYDNLSFTFYEKGNINTIRINKKLSEDYKNGIKVSTYDAYWDLTGESCYFTIADSETIYSYTIYFTEKGIKKSLIFYFRK
jgi:hypothetical protein